MAEKIEKIRRVFEKDCIASLAGHIKKSGWKKSGNAVFRELNGFLLSYNMTVYLNKVRTTCRLQVKPMALDPILWEILGFHGNMREPLSFRVWGAFTCSALPIFESDIESEGDTPHQVAGNFFDRIRDTAQEVVTEMQSKSFTEQIRQDPNQVERGAYAITLVTSLINDQRYEDATRLAEAYASGKLHSCFQLNSSGKSFHEHALSWLYLKQPPNSGSALQ